MSDSLTESLATWQLESLMGERITIELQRTRLVPGAFVDIRITNEYGHTVTAQFNAWAISDLGDMLYHKLIELEIARPRMVT